ncbi:hypothetical protein NSK_000119 [Nannochloropsis salina CCMP1776]|uniref:Gag1-like clamp domain-containing protein n=1 Tax=Nannochloropsis salina CCMP1776 TaxID=1027361 RepID=A0A4D9DFS2_9STRA|nr:hypothetical protein NSK_000119 [Nannochloropsis salina CCMP1776]|eukprot:TFJ88545.1 hypothetical protein NSK_000119 [Nannochloropsis salina CCMP1776]
MSKNFKLNGESAAAIGEVGSLSEASTATERGAAESPSAGSTHASREEYVNSGLKLWSERRREWQSKNNQSEGGGTRSEPPPARSQLPKRARSVDVDHVIESIFSTTGDARLPQPVPLSQMIDLLVDFWEADGLYD